MTTKTITSKTLSATAGQLLTTLSGRGQDIFTVSDAERVLHKPNTAVRKLLHGLAKRRWLQRLEKGKYLIVPLSAGMDSHYTENELVIASHLIAPYYISYWTALSHYGLTEQPTRTVYIAITKRRQPLTLHGVTYRFITLTRQKFFGYTRDWIGDKPVQMADRAKTLVDCLDHPELCGGIIEIAKGLWRSRNKVDWKQLTTYAQRMGNGAVLKRLGYLLQVLELGPANFSERFRTRLTAGYVVLDPLAPRKGSHNARWRLLINVDPAELVRWRGT
jgi:predicted transcriptional regulator of viral defense system